MQESLTRSLHEHNAQRQEKNDTDTSFLTVWINTNLTWRHRKNMRHQKRRSGRFMCGKPEDNCSSLFHRICFTGSNSMQINVLFHDPGTDSRQGNFLLLSVWYFSCKHLTLVFVFHKPTQEILQYPQSKRHQFNLTRCNISPKKRITNSDC